MIHRMHPDVAKIREFWGKSTKDNIKASLKEAARLAEELTDPKDQEEASGYMEGLAMLAEAHGVDISKRRGELDEEDQ